VPKLLWFRVVAKPKHTITRSPTHNSLPAIKWIIISQFKITFSIKIYSAASHWGDFETKFLSRRATANQRPFRLATAD